MFLTRCRDATKKNSLYFTSHLVRDVVKCNSDRDALKIINTGVKAFVKCENKGATCDFRLAQEGALMTIPFLSKRAVNVTKQDLEVLLESSDVDLPPEHQTMSEATREQLNSLDTGSIALVFNGPSDSPNSQLKLELVGWKGKNSIRAYVPKNERIHYMRLLGCDTSKYERNKFEDRRAKNGDGSNNQDKEQIVSVDSETTEK